MYTVQCMYVLYLDLGFFLRAYLCAFILYAYFCTRTFQFNLTSNNWKYSCFEWNKYWFVVNTDTHIHSCTIKFAKIRALSTVIVSCNYKLIVHFDQPVRYVAHFVNTKVFSSAFLTFVFYSRTIETEIYYIDNLHSLPWIISSILTKFTVRINYR